jgi:hypothetical protein
VPRRLRKLSHDGYVAGVKRAIANPACNPAVSIDCTTEEDRYWVAGLKAGMWRVFWERRSREREFDKHTLTEGKAGSNKPSEATP